MLTLVVELRTPIVEATIERRVVIVYRLDPDVVADLIPGPFEAQMVKEFAVGATSFTSVKHLRPRGLPPWLGRDSEHAAHLIAVTWLNQRRPAIGVFCSRRHTSSRVIATSSDRLFPGTRELADFAVDDHGSKVHIAFVSRKGTGLVDAEVTVGEPLVGSALFATTEEASRHIRRGAVAYSLRRKGGLLDGLELRTRTWPVEPARIDHVRSSFFDDPNVFPPGTAVADSAFVMRDVAADWRAAPPPITPAGAWLH
jgi:hypothetical protein